MNRLSLENLTVYREETGITPIIKDINLHMGRGQILGLLGPNGCGKTSLIRAIAGFIPCAPHQKVSTRLWDWTASWGNEQRRMRGRVLLDDDDVSNLLPGKRGIALVPQNLALYPDKSVLDNIAFPLRARGTTKSEARLRASELVARLGLSEVMLNRPAQISGGQQQRVAIGRALIGQPRLVLLDEPLASLDALSKHEILAFISHVLREREASAVYVTHDPNEATLLCDKVAFINKGQLQQVASPGEAYNNPATLFVARMFAGFSSVICGYLQPSGLFTNNHWNSGWNLKPLLKNSNSFPAIKVWLAGRPNAFRLTSTEQEGVTGTVVGHFSLEGSHYARVEIEPGVLISCVDSFGHSISSQVNVQIASDVIGDLLLFNEEENPLLSD